AVRLAVSGATVEPAAGGARLALENSGRKIAYSRLRVTDATGRELTAGMEVRSVGEEGTPGGKESRTPALCHPTGRAVAPSQRVAEGERAAMLLVLVNDAEAVYPVRIDPTFSDANWSSMGGFPGVHAEFDVYDTVKAAVVDGSGNLYIGGDFT